MTLHCLYVAQDTDTLNRLHATIAPGDALLLLGKAVVLARKPAGHVDAWRSAGIRVCALEEDLMAYGCQDPSNTVETVDYRGWVDLTAQHAQQQVWR